MFGVSKNKGSRWTLFWLEFQVLLRYNFNELVIKRPLYASFFYIIFTLSGLLVGFTNFRQATSQPKAFQRVLQSNRSLSIIYSLAMYAKIMRSDRRVASKCRTGLYDGVALTYPALLVPAKYVILFGTLHAIPFLLYSAIVYPVAGLAPTFFDRGLLFIVILWMQDLACMSIGFFLSCTLENYLISEFLLQVYVVFNFLFDGQSTNGSDVTPILWWLRFLTVTYYTAQALTANQSGIYNSEDWFVLLPLWFSLTILTTQIVLFLGLAILFFHLKYGR